MFQKSRSSNTNSQRIDQLTKILHSTSSKSDRWDSWTIIFIMISKEHMAASVLTSLAFGRQNVLADRDGVSQTSWLGFKKRMYKSTRCDSLCAHTSSAQKHGLCRPEQPTLLILVSFQHNSFSIKSWICFPDWVVWSDQWWRPSQKAHVHIECGSSYLWTHSAARSMLCSSTHT